MFRTLHGMGGGDWHTWIWTATAAVLVVLSVALLAWSLLADRSRGRRRCPRCWYDMQGVPGLVCPECGKDARTERGLGKTRIRRRWVVVGVIVLLGSYPVYHVPIVRDKGWWAAAPTWVLILKAPAVKEEAVGFFRGSTKEPLALAVGERLFESDWKLRRLWWWDRALLPFAAARALEAENLSARRLGARLAACVWDDAVERAPERVRGMVTLFAAGHAYANAETYVGLGTTESGHGNARSMIVFRRGAGVRCESVIERQSITYPTHIAVWGDAQPMVWTDWGDTSPLVLHWRYGVLRQHPHVPVQLFELLRVPVLAADFDLPDMYDPTWVGAEEIDGVETDHVFVFTLQRERIDVWVERGTRLVRRLKYSEKIKSGTTTYRSRFNVEVDEALLTFDPARAKESPLMRDGAGLPLDGNR